MPEGDTIWRSAAALRARLAGRTLERVRPARLERLAGRRLIAVETVGKHLNLRFEGGLALHSHMRMTGSWHLYGSGQRWQKPAHLATAVLGFGDTDAVLFAAPVLEIVAAGQAETAPLGPDILAVPFDLHTVIARAATAGHATVAELLLDQRVCAGIGNIYRCDALWAEALDPWTAPGDVGEARLRRLYSSARRWMRESCVATARRPSLVHGRAGRPCRRCATLIAVRPVGVDARLVYWCPECQGSGGSAVRLRGSTR